MVKKKKENYMEEIRLKYISNYNRYERLVVIIKKCVI